MSEETADIKRHLRRAWQQRDRHGVWFYGTWLFHRYYGTAIVINMVTISTTVALVLMWKADAL